MLLRHLSWMIGGGLYAAGASAALAQLPVRDATVSSRGAQTIELAQWGAAEDDRPWGAPHEVSPQPPVSDPLRLPPPAVPGFGSPETGPGALDIGTLTAMTAAKISWRVENPFRFFTDPKDTAVHRATFEALSPDQRRAGPVLAAERALSRRYESGWAERMVSKVCWTSRKNRHACPDGSDYVNPASHNVEVRLENVHEPDIDCRWLGTPLGGANMAEIGVTKPCGEPVTFSAPYPAGLQVSVSVGDVEVASTEIRVEDIFVVGLGDSFGSGEGNPDVPVRFSPERSLAYGGDKTSELGGYPARVGAWKQVGDKAFVKHNARWLDQACHRSLYSYQLRAALQLAVEDPHRAVTFAGFACSGAEIVWGFFLRYAGNEWVPNPPDLSQVSAAADAQCGRVDAPVQDMPEAYHIQGAIPELKGGVVLHRCPAEYARKIDLLLVSIGGNDVGFARLVANAVLSDSSLVRRLGGWFGQVHGNQQSAALLNRLDTRYKAMNRALHGILHIPWEEADRIILTAYPPFSMLDDAGAVCADGSAGMEVFSDFAITQSAALTSAWLADKLDQIQAETARQNEWTFVSDHRKAFVGRGLCAGHTNGLGSIADDLRLPRLKEGVWVPYNPAHFEPYAARQRWFRTPNDAFMTGNFHVAGSVMQTVLKLQSFSWFQVLLASTYSGAFHPTAEGHAAISDTVVLQAREVLARYGAPQKPERDDGPLQSIAPAPQTGPSAGGGW